MNRTARILIAAVSGLTVLPLATAGASEATAPGPTAPAARAYAQPLPAGTQAGLHPYYVVPFFPFLWPVPPGHPAASLPQAQAPQTPPYPAYPFVIWLPVQLSAMPPAPPATPVPAAVGPPAEQPVTEPAVAAAQPIPPQAAATEAGPAVQEAAGPLTVFKTPPPPAVELSPLPKGPEQGLKTSTAVQPSPEAAAAKDVPPKESARPGAITATKPKPAATRPAATKPAQKDSAHKRKLCWKDGKLDVCK